MKRTRVNSGYRSKLLYVFYILWLSVFSVLFSGCSKPSNVKEPDILDTPLDPDFDLAEINAAHNIGVAPKALNAFFDNFDYIETQERVIFCLKGAGHSIRFRHYYTGYVVISTACQSDNPESTFYIVRFEGVRCFNGGNTIRNPCRIVGGLTVNACNSSKITVPNEHDIFLTEAIDSIINFYAHISFQRWAVNHDEFFKYGGPIPLPNSCSGSPKVKIRDKQ